MPRVLSRCRCLVELPVLIQPVDQLPGVAVQHGRVQVPAVLHQGLLEPVAGPVGDLVGQRVDAAHDHGGVPLREHTLGLRGGDEREPRRHRLTGDRAAATERLRGANPRGRFAREMRSRFDTNTAVVRQPFANAIDRACT